MFGFPRLQELVAKHGGEERLLAGFLMEEIYSFVGEGWEQEDDINLLTLQRCATLLQGGTYDLRQLDRIERARRYRTPNRCLLPAPLPVAVVRQPLQTLSP